eukprot:gene24791-32285_t
MPAGDIGFYDPHKETRPLQTGDIPLDFVYPILGLCCFSVGIYTEGFHICGCASRRMCLTSNCEQLTCKPARYPNSTNSCCTTHECRSECFWPPTFYKVVDQFFCLDTRLGIPCDDDVPFLINVLGFTLFYKNLDFVGEWCLSFKDLKIKHDGLVAPVPIPQSGDLVQQYKG